MDVSISAFIYCMYVRYGDITSFCNYTVKYVVMGPSIIITKLSYTFFQIAANRYHTSLRIYCINL